MRFQTNGLIAPGKYGFAVKTENGWSVLDAERNPIGITVPATKELNVLKRSEYRLLGLETGESRVIRFADLHRHSDNSLQDGMTKVKEMVARTEYAGALTDHGNMYGYLEFYKGMKKAGKKPILGFDG